MPKPCWRNIFSTSSRRSSDFADEDRVLYQFQRKHPFNRYFRFDCDNPKTRIGGDAMEIETGPGYRDTARYPIDFFIVHGDALHIVPVEALSEGKLPLAQLGSGAPACPMAPRCPRASAGASPAKPRLSASR